MRRPSEAGSRRGSDGRPRQVVTSALSLLRLHWRATGRYRLPEPIDQAHEPQRGFQVLRD